MLFDRYRSHIQDFQELIRGIVGTFGTHLFHSFQKNAFHFHISKNSMFENDVGPFLELFGVPWCLQKQIILVLGVMDTSENPKIMKMSGFRVLP